MRTRTSWQISSRALDEDQDGRIGRDELVRAATREKYPEFPPIVEKVFPMSDLDEDDALDRGEAERFMDLLDVYVSEQGSSPASVSNGTDPFSLSFPGSQDEGADVLADLFRMLDVDQDGKISRDELVNAAAQEEDPDFPSIVEKVFALSDLDEDGALDRREAERFMELLDVYISEQGPLPAIAGHGAESSSFGVVGSEDGESDVLADLFRMLDADQDGRISMDELIRVAAPEGGPDFPRVVERLFALADSDGDGTLDKREAEEFMVLLDRHATVTGWLVDEGDVDAVDEDGVVEQDFPQKETDEGEDDEPEDHAEPDEELLEDGDDETVDESEQGGEEE